MRGHLVNAILAIGFSILIWGAVDTQISEERAVNIGFVIRVGDTVTISTGDGIGATGQIAVPLQVKVRGPREAVARLSAREIVGLRDLTTADEVQRLRGALDEGGTEDVEVRARDLSLPPELELVDTTPTSFRVRLSPVRSKEVPVKVRTAGDPADGYRALPAVIEPAEVRVRGPVDLLAEVHEVFTEPVTLSGRRSGLTVERSVDAPPGTVVDQSVLVRLEIEPEPVRQEVQFPVVWLGASKDLFKTLVVEPVRPGDGWTVRIPLSGGRDAIKRLADDLAEEIKLPGSRQHLPKAYMRAKDLPEPTEQGAEEGIDVEVIGLPPGVSYEGPRVQFGVRVKTPPR
ncbi:MAG: CdaR family protein [Planctomycetota bacterium]